MGVSNELANNSSGVGYYYRLGRRSVRIRLCIFSRCLQVRESGPEAKAPVVQATPIVKGPVVRELPAPEK
jgi:hypothetical protein